MLITLLVYVLIFCLLWWLITIIPFPPPPAPQFRWVAFAVLVIVAIIVLLNLVGVHLP